MRGKMKGKKKEAEGGGFLHTILEFVEKDRFTIVTGTIYLMVIGIIRSYSESIIFEYRGFSYYLMAQHVIFFLFVLTLGILVFSLAGKIEPKKAYNASMLGISLILLPPFLDRYLFGVFGAENGERYEFVFSYTFDNLLSGDFSNFGTPGLKIMFALVFSAAVIYVILKKKSLSRTLIFTTSLFAMVFSVAVTHTFLLGYHFPRDSFTNYVLIFWTYKHEISPFYYQFMSAYVPYIDIQGVLMSPYLKYVVLQQKSLTLASLFMGLAIVNSLAIAWFRYKKVLKELLAKIDLSLLFVCISVILGVAIVKGQDMDHSGGLALKMNLIPHFTYVFIMLMIVSLSWLFIKTRAEYGTITRNREWNSKHSLSRYQYGQISLAFGILALLLSTLLGWIAFVLTVFMLALCMLPRASKRSGALERIANAFKKPLPAATVIAFFLGFFSPSMWLLVGPYLMDIRPIPGTTEVFFDWSPEQNINMAIPRIPELVPFMLLMLAPLLILAVSWALYFDREETVAPESRRKHHRKHRADAAEGKSPPDEATDNRTRYLFGALGSAALLLPALANIAPLSRILLIMASLIHFINMAMWSAEARKYLFTVALILLLAGGLLAF